MSTEGVNVTPSAPSMPSSPFVPFVPSFPFAPSAPRGMVNFKTAALGVPVFSTLAFVPAAPVTTSPTVIVAAAPSAPSAPFCPVAPRGMVKLRIASPDVPTFSTLAFVPGSPVTTCPTLTVAASP